MADPAPKPAPSLLRCLKTGGRAGLRTTLFLLKFIIPVSLVVTVLSWTGLLARIAEWIAPLFRHFGLPGETAIAFITGAALNVYSAIAAMEVMHLDARQVTILAIMVLISHNLPIECVVQHKAGSSGWRMLLLRLFMSAVAGVLLNLLMPGQANLESAGAAAAPAFSGDYAKEALAWVLSTLKLIGKIAVFATGVMVLQRVLDEYGVMGWLTRALAWPLAFLGLPRSTAFLWIIANTLGLAYGAGIMIEEFRLGRLNRRDSELINHSVAVCHSLLEDTLLFVLLAGASAFWITLPRLLLASAAVWGYRLWAGGRDRSHEVAAD